MGFGQGLGKSRDRARHSSGTAFFWHAISRPFDAGRTRPGSHMQDSRGKARSGDCTARKNLANSWLRTVTLSQLPEASPEGSQAVWPISGQRMIGRETPSPAGAAARPHRNGTRDNERLRILPEHGSIPPFSDIAHPAGRGCLKAPLRSWCASAQNVSAKYGV